MPSPSSFGLALAGWACALLVAAAPARSANLPAPSTNVMCSVEGNTFMNAAFCEFGGGPGIWSSARAEANLSIPYAVAVAATPTNGALGAGASATVLYWFQVTGPAVGLPVPIQMDIYLNAQATIATLESFARARMIVNTTSGVFRGYEACSNGLCEESTISETISLTVLSGSVRDTVTLYAEAQAPHDLSANQSALATADPYIYVDPSFPDAHLYSVVVSAGVGNAPPSPIPEPGRGALLGAGLLALALRLARLRGTPA